MYSNLFIDHKNVGCCAEQQLFDTFDATDSYNTPSKYNNVSHNPFVLR